MTRRALWCVAVLAAMSVAIAGGRADDCNSCAWSPYWSTTADGQFPETAILKPTRSLGIAFSGGGTRSASMTVGQLRGLRQIGLLDQVEYVSAVSGGSWAAVPFVYSSYPLDDLLGTFQPPATLDPPAVMATPNGRMVDAIVKSSLGSGSVREVVGALGRITTRNLGNQLISAATSAIDARLRREPERLDKTYARLLGRLFIDPLIGSNASRLPFAWHADVQTLGAESGAIVGDEISLSTPGRPFLIANATIIYSRDDYSYPLLMPIEYTPMYVGVRHRFGNRFGGVYIRPWAYDSSEVVDVDRAGHRIRFRYDASRALTLADVVASSGAAPQLQVMLGAFAPAALRSRVQRVSEVFPAFRHLAIPDGSGTRALLSETIGHGDGGFGDNLGIMPLLARHVRHIIVFNNTNTKEIKDNDDLKSLFFSVGPPDGSGDRTGNVVFPAAEYEPIRDELLKRRAAGEPEVYCGPPLAVLGNEKFGVTAYDGVNVCWVYNSLPKGWTDALEAPLQGLVTGTDKSKAARGFTNFPWIATFFQNPGHVIKLETPQVNLLSNLTAWIVARSEQTLKQHMLQ